MPFYERWQIALKTRYKRALHVPMEGRSTTRLGALASPALVSGFMRLAAGAAAGTIGAAVIDGCMSTDAHVHKASEAAEKARAEEQETEKANEELGESTKAIHEAGITIKKSHPALLASFTALEASTTEGAAQAEAALAAAKKAAAEAHDDAKKARAASFAPGAREAADDAEKAEDKVEQAKVKILEVQAGAKVYRDIAEVMAQGLSPMEIAQALQAAATESQKEAAEAAKVVDAQSAALAGLSGIEDLKQAADLIEDEAEKVRVAASDSDEIAKVLTSLKGMPVAEGQKDPGPAIDEALATNSAHAKEMQEAATKADGLSKAAQALVDKAEDSADTQADVTQAAAATAGNSSAFAVLGFFAWLVGRSSATKGRKKDEERLKKYPFPINNYDKALATAPASFRSVAVTVTFAGANPSLESVASALAKVDRKATAAEEKKTLVITKKAVQTMLARTNHSAYVWLVRLFDELLLPLHATNPIAKVEIKAFGTMRTLEAMMEEEAGGEGEEEGEGDEDEGEDEGE